MGCRDADCEVVAQPVQAYLNGMIMVGLVQHEFVDQTWDRGTCASEGRADDRESELGRGEIILVDDVIHNGDSGEDTKTDWSITRIDTTTYR